MIKSLLVGLADDTADTWSTPAPSLRDRLLALLPTMRTHTKGEDVADFIAANGGVMTNTLEREISRKFGGFAGSN